MKLQTALMLAVLTAPALSAQTPAAPATPAPAVVTANPVVWAANDVYARQAKFIVAAAEEMPADKYTFHPTPDQRSYAWIVSHLAQSNGGICGILADTPAPATTKVPETASKEDLIKALNASFDFCNTTMAGLTDPKLADTVTFFRGARVPRARALIEITGDLEDHYSQMAGYLRLNGLLPPSATPKK